MTTATASAATALEGLVENCRRAWSDLLSRAVGASCNVQVAQQAGPGPESVAVCILIRAEGALCGEAALIMDSRNAGLLAAKIAGSSSNVQVVQDLVRQAVAIASSELQKQFGAIRVQVTAGTTPVWQPYTALAFLAGNGSPEPLRMYFLLSQQMASPAPQPSVPPPAMSAPAMAGPLSEARPAELQPQNLGFLMGIELEVTLRFGQKKLPLRQLVELSSGSVIELDKRVHEPVELLLRDKVVARGEVVIVEGHYGLRVTDVCANPQL
jgi:flagellar motor switch protein FliN